MSEQEEPRNAGDENTTPLSQQSTSSSRSGGFRKYPELGNVFQREAYTGKRQGKVTCIFCQSQVKSNKVQVYFDHILSCNTIPNSVKSDYLAIRADYMDKKRSPEEKKADIFLTLLIMEYKCPMRMIESENFRNFVRVAPQGYIAPSRAQVSKEIIPKIAQKLQESFTTAVQASADFTWTIEFDHWRDLSRRSILGVVATHPDGSRHLLDLEEVSLKGHSSEAIRESLSSCLSKLPRTKINAIISDSASSCKKARDNLSFDFEYIHIIAHRCTAHLLNLIGSRFANALPLRSLMERANQLSAYLSNDTLYLARSRQSGHTRVKTQCRTRWYADVDMLESLETMESRERPALVYLRERLESAKTQRDKDKFECLIAIIEDESFWEDLREAIRYFRPLANCVAVAERADGSLGEAVKEILEYSKIVCGADVTSRFGLVAIESFFGYFNEEYLGNLEFGTMLAAYFLDRRYKMDYMTENSRAIVLRTVAKLAGFTGYSSKDIETILYSEFRQFCHQKGQLSKIAAPGVKARDWWNDQPSKQGSLSILRAVAIRLANLRSSSANTERLFSILKLIQGLNRTNYSIETLTSMGRAQLSMTQDDYGNALYDLIKDTRNIDEDCDEDGHSNTLRQTRAINCRRTTKRIRTIPSNVEIPGYPGIPGSQADGLESALQLDQGCDQAKDVSDKQRKRSDIALASYSEFRKLVDFTKITNLREEYNHIIDDALPELDLDQLERRFREDEELFANLSQESSSSCIDHSLSSCSLSGTSFDQTISSITESPVIHQIPGNTSSQLNTANQSSQAPADSPALLTSPALPENQGIPGCPAFQGSQTSAKNSCTESYLNHNGPSGRLP